MKTCLSFFEFYYANRQTDGWTDREVWQSMWKRFADFRWEGSRNARSSFGLRFRGL